MRHTTRALRAVRPFVSLTELAMLHELVRAGLSYDTGAGIISYARLADAARLSRRQVMRYIRRFEGRGILVVKRRYWHTVRPTGDVNRANEYFFPIADEALVFANSEPPPEAFEDGDSDFNPPRNDGADDAQAASTAPPPASPADTRPSAVKADAQAASVPCSNAPSGDADQVADQEVAVCILETLTSHPELTTIADIPTAARLAGVARRNRKTLVLVQAAIAAAVDKAAGREGRTLETFVASLIRAEDGRSIKPSTQKLSDEDRARQRAEAAEMERRLQERGEEERARKLRAAAALRGPP